MQDVARYLRELIVASDEYRRVMAAGVGVSTNEAAVLGELLHEGPLTPGQVSARTGLTAASATALVDRLASAGHVARSAHPLDGRRVLVELTDRGRSAIETMFSLFADDLEEAVGRVEPAVADDPVLRDALADVLRSMAASLRTRAADAADLRSTLDAATPR